MRTFMGIWGENSQPCKYNIINVEVPQSDQQEHWQNTFVGKIRQVVAVFIPKDAPHPIYIDNEDGNGIMRVNGKEVGVLRILQDPIHLNDVVEDAFLKEFSQVKSDEIENEIREHGYVSIGGLLDDQMPNRIMTEPESVEAPTAKIDYIPKKKKAVKKKAVKKAKKNGKK